MSSFNVIDKLFFSLEASSAMTIEENSQHKINKVQKILLLCVCFTIDFRLEVDYQF
jgi:hypothetical protein